MKKFIIVPVCIVLFSLVFQGCKKGDNDPFLSLRTRTLRLTGTWVCKSSTTTSTEISTNGLTTDTITRTITFSDTTFIETVTNSDGTTVSKDTTTGSSEIQFEKDGDYTLTQNSERDSIIWGLSATIQTTTTTEGHWYWAGSNESNNTKNKEILFLDPESKSITTITIQNGGTPETETTSHINSGLYSDLTYMKLDKLTNKELDVKMEGASSVTDGNSYSVTKEASYEKD